MEEKGELAVYCDSIEEWQHAGHAYEWNKVVEFDSKGKVVWKISNADFEGKPFDDPCGAQRLPNGNTVITSYHAGGDKIKIFEVTRDKKMVWKYSGKHKAHEFQILTTNGKPLEGPLMK